MFAPCSSSSIYFCLYMLFLLLTLTRFCSEHKIGRRHLIPNKRWNLDLSFFLCNRYKWRFEITIGIDETEADYNSIFWSFAVETNMASISADASLRTTTTNNTIYGQKIKLKNKLARCVATSLPGAQKVWALANWLHVMRVFLVFFYSDFSTMSHHVPVVGLWCH